MPAFTCGICDCRLLDIVPIWLSIEGVYGELSRMATHVSNEHGLSRDALIESLDTFYEGGVIKGRAGPGYLAGALPDGMEWFRIHPDLRPPMDIHLS